MPRNKVQRAGRMTRLLGQNESLHYADARAFLSGDVALRALATILPHVNRHGAGKKRVNEALAVIDDAPDAQQLLLKAATTRAGYQREYHMDGGESMLGSLPPGMRLAMEMALHSDDERRAMEGELQELEARWRDAETIAKISDGLLVPESVDNRHHALREKQPEAFEKHGTE